MVWDFTAIGTPRLTLILPIKTVSEANRFEHWKVRANRQRVYCDLIKAVINPISNLISLPCSICLTRYGPRSLDEHDNLRMCFKKIVDVLAEILTGKGRGKGDNDPRLSWKYDQVKSKDYGIKIVFEL